jgi:hypothetical protein
MILKDYEGPSCNGSQTLSSRYLRRFCCMFGAYDRSLPQLPSRPNRIPEKKYCAQWRHSALRRWLSDDVAFCASQAVSDRMALSLSCALVWPDLSSGHFSFSALRKARHCWRAHLFSECYQLRSSVVHIELLLMQLRIAFDQHGMADQFFHLLQPLSVARFQLLGNF